MRNRIIVVCVFVLVIPFADFTIVENSSKSNIGADSDDVEKAGRILNDFHDIFKYVTSNVARLMLPVMLKITEDVNVSRSCIEGGMRLLEDLKQNKGWTLQLIDSFGKPFGIIRGKFWLHGDYDQCLNIEAIEDKTRKNEEKLNTIYGKFCALTIGFNSYEFSDVPVDNNTKNILNMMKDFVKPFPLRKLFEMANYSKVIFRVDICIPSTCSQEDIENILHWAMKDSYRAEVKFCKVKDDKIRLSTSQIICIAAISVFITWVFIGTFLEILIIQNIVNVPCDKECYFEN
ncbi:uncharacterized protein LOC111627024 [Centruroides sculpturatus]|uniref:uncharacterized protein LOC111627024 n=1 Tax=Centruroides sculpturatus TaxID=218467 RepID=UPI000C6CD902|nr:uncharacterized protein LOC111627024 [Centruroides sculpturatus]